jgi:hypothetical protein
MKRNLWKWLWVLAVLAFTATAFADIEVKPQYDANEPIRAVVTITDVPAGAKLRGSFAVSDGSYLPVVENTYDIWAAPGKHTVTAQGVWVLTEPVVVGDKTIQVLVDFGQFSYSRTFTVGPEVPTPPPFPPTPPVPPVPPGQRWAVIWEETDQQRTPVQGNLYLNLRKEFPDERLQILDVTNLPPSLRVLESQRPPSLPLPVLMVVVRQPDGADRLLRTVPLPSSVADVVEEIAK